MSIADMLKLVAPMESSPAAAAPQHPAARNLFDLTRIRNDPATQWLGGNQFGDYTSFGYKPGATPELLGLPALGAGSPIPTDFGGLEYYGNTLTRQAAENFGQGPGIPDGEGNYLQNGSDSERAHWDSVLNMLNLYGVNSISELPWEAQQRVGVLKQPFVDDGGLGGLIKKGVSYDPVARNLPETNMLIDALGTDLKNPFGPEKGLFDVLGAGPVGQITSGGHSIGLDPNDPGDRGIGRTIGSIAGLVAGAGALGLGGAAGAGAETGLSAELAAGAPELAGSMGLSAGGTSGLGAGALSQELASGSIGSGAGTGIGAGAGLGELGGSELWGGAGATASGFMPGEVGGIPTSMGGGSVLDQLNQWLTGGGNAGAFPWTQFGSGVLGAYGNYQSGQVAQDLLNRSNKWDALAYDAATHGIGGTPYGQEILKSVMASDAAKGYNGSGNILADLAKGLNIGTVNYLQGLNGYSNMDPKAVGAAIQQPQQQASDIGGLLGIATGNNGQWQNIFNGLGSLLA